MTTGNESAMPLAFEEEYGDYGKKQLIVRNGLTIRQHYAGLAMNSLIEGGGYIAPDAGEKEIQRLAAQSVQIANALIKELNKDEKRTEP